MNATDTIRALMLDGRPRTPSDVMRETGLPEWPVRSALYRLCFDYHSPLLLRFLAPPSIHTPAWDLKRRRRRIGSFYRLNPNCREALGVGVGVKGGAS